MRGCAAAGEEVGEAAAHASRESFALWKASPLLPGMASLPEHACLPIGRGWSRLEPPAPALSLIWRRWGELADACGRLFPYLVYCFPHRSFAVFMQPWAMEPMAVPAGIDPAVAQVRV